MLAASKELFVEPSCEHSAAKKSACNRPTPGATSGGCAFEGAQISLFPFAEAAHIVHSPATCLGASWETRQTRTTFSGRDMTQMGLCTQIGENEVIFGGEKKLAAAIDEAVATFAPKAVFVYSTCVTALIGDDIEAICKAKSAEYDIPVVPVDAPGFVGSKNFGSRLAGEAVLNYLIGTLEPTDTKPYEINLLGEYNVTGDMERYKSILEEIGITIRATLSGDGRIDSIRTAHRAKLNVLVCAQSLLTLARKMQERYGIPFVSVSFYGKRDTSSAIREIAVAFNDAALLEKAKKVIAKYEAICDEKLSPIKAKLQGKKAILNTGGNKSWAFVSALQDIGIDVAATAIGKSTLEDQAKAREYLGKSGVLMKKPAEEQAKLLKETKADILLAGGRSLYTALKNNVAFADVNQEKKVSYGGYDGLIAFANDVLAA
ncbi:MAG: nitrogenase molybdenum-cofactor biosynthesis protein NifE, partial [Helicobacteraceae bacterium]|nr:nitrogenase molybdenum-cofactor biosynthesis protein NifE [Helicobacteraceae bacterium]